MSMESWMELYGEGLRRGASTWVTKNTLTKAGWNITATEALEELRSAGIAEPVGAKGTREYFQVKAMAQNRGSAGGDYQQAELQARVKRLEARVEELERLLVPKKGTTAAAAVQAEAPVDDDEEPPF